MGRGYTKTKDNLSVKESLDTYSPLNLTRLRVNNGLTQKEIADAIGVSLTSAKFWESGRRFMPAKRWEELKRKIEGGEVVSGLRSRRKGHSFERWVANKLKKIYPEARRHLEYQASEALGVDVANCGEYRIQCKRGKRYASLTAIEEIQICPIEGGVPVLVTKGDNKEPLACMPFEHFIKLVKNQK